MRDIRAHLIAVRDNGNGNDDEDESNCGDALSVVGARRGRHRRHRRRSCDACCCMPADQIMLRVAGERTAEVDYAGSASASASASAHTVRRDVSAAACVYGEEIRILVRGYARGGAVAEDSLRVVCVSSLASAGVHSDGHAASPEEEEEEEEAAASSSTVVCIAWVARHELFVVARRNGWMGSVTLVPSSADARYPLAIEVEELGIIPAGIACASFGAGFRRPGGAMHAGNADVDAVAETDFGVVVCRDGTLMSIDCESLSPVSEAFVGEGDAAAAGTGGGADDADDDDGGGEALSFDGEVRFRGDGRCFATMLVASRGVNCVCTTGRVDCRVWRIGDDGRITMESVADAIDGVDGVGGVHVAAVDVATGSRGGRRYTPRVALAWEPKGSVWAAVERKRWRLSEAGDVPLKDKDADRRMAARTDGVHHDTGENGCETRYCGLRIVFRERNGLIRSSLPLPDTVVDVSSMSWNCASDVLALVCTRATARPSSASTPTGATENELSGSRERHDVSGTPCRYSVCFYTRRNYHWYLKREVVCADVASSEADSPQIAWDVDTANKLWIFSYRLDRAQELEAIHMHVAGTSERGTSELKSSAVLVELSWITRVSASCGMPRAVKDARGVGSVAAVTDANTLMLTSFRDAAVPPPMCHVIVETNDSIIAADVAEWRRPPSRDGAADAESVDVVAAITNAGDIVIVRKKSTTSWRDTLEDCDALSSSQGNDDHKNLFEDSGVPSKLYTVGQVAPVHQRLVAPRPEDPASALVRLDAGHGIIDTCWIDSRHIAVAMPGGLITMYDVGGESVHERADLRYCGQVSVQTSLRGRASGAASPSQSIVSLAACQNLMHSSDTCGVRDFCDALVVHMADGGLCLVRYKRSVCENQEWSERGGDIGFEENLSVHALAGFPTMCTSVIACRLELNTRAILVVIGLSGRDGAVYRVVDGSITSRCRATSAPTPKSADVVFREGVTSLGLHIGPNFDCFGERDAWIVTTHSTDVMRLTGLEDFLSRDISAAAGKAGTSVVPYDGDNATELTGNLHSRMRVAMCGAGVASTQRGDTKSRAIEPGSLLVCTMPRTSGVVVQAPRGNIELFYPRCFLVNNVMACIRAGKYHEACRVCRSHRIDFNIVVDCNWPRCIRSDVAAAFVKDLVEQSGAGTPGTSKSPMDLLCDLLNELREGSVFDADGAYASVTPLRDDGYQEITVDDSARELLSQPKSTAVCLALRRALFACLDQEARETRPGGFPRSKTKLLMDLMEATLLTFIKCDGESDCEGALRFIQEKATAGSEDSGANADDAVDAERVREFGIRRLLLILDGNSAAVCRAALATYDVELCCYTYYYSDRDPLEFLPELEDLRAYCSLERRLVIDERLLKFTKCVDWIVALLLGAGDEQCARQSEASPDGEPGRRLSDDHLMSKLLEVVEKDSLHGYASQLVRRRVHDEKEKQRTGGSVSAVELLRAITRSHGEHLCSQNRYDDAAMCFMEAKEYHRCQECYQAQLNWRMSLFVASHFNGYAERELRQLANELVEGLMEVGGDGEKLEASRLLLHVIRDVDGAIRVLCDIQEWRECMQIVSVHGRGDLLKTFVAPRVATAASAVLDDCRDYCERLDKYLNRLREVEKSHARLRDLVDAQGASVFDDNDDDGMSQLSAYTSASTSTRASSTQGPSSTAGSYRQKKKEKKNRKKGGKIRAGAVNEEAQLREYIINDLAPLRIVEARRLGELLELLIVLGHGDDAVLVQAAYGVYETSHRAAVLEVHDGAVAVSAALSSPHRWKWEVLR